MSQLQTNPKSCEEILKEFTSMDPINEFKETLQELFEEWVIFSAGETDDDTRSSKVWHYRQLMKLLNDIEKFES